MVPALIAAVKRGAGPMLAEADGRCLERRDGAGADQQIRLQGRGRQRDEMQAPDAAPDQRPRRRHGDAGLFARHRQDGAVGDSLQRGIKGPNDHDIAAFTRSGENGTRRIRTPVASKIALAIAAATGRIEGSPAPEGGSSG